MTEPTVVMYGVWFPTTAVYAAPSAGPNPTTAPNSTITCTPVTEQSDNTDSEAEAVAEVVRVYLDRGLSQKAQAMLRLILERAEGEKP